MRTGSKLKTLLLFLTQLGLGPELVPSSLFFVTFRLSISSLKCPSWTHLMILCSASFISIVEIGCIGWLPFCFTGSLNAWRHALRRLVLNLRIQATNFLRSCHEENLLNTSSILTVASFACTAPTEVVFLTSGSSLEIFSTLDWFGHLSFCSHKKDGPIFHRVAVRRASTLSPLDASSAGFNLVGTCLHWTGVEPSRIWDTLFATKVWNLVLLLAMYFSTDVLSVQKTDSSTDNSNSLLIILSSLTATVAADSSSRGMLMDFRGASLDLAMRSAQWTWLPSSTRRR